jgi:hypothetical protein
VAWRYRSPGGADGVEAPPTPIPATNVGIEKSGIGSDARQRPRDDWFDTTERLEIIDAGLIAPFWGDDDKRDRVRDTTRTRLGEEVYEREVRRGAAMDYDAAVAYTVDVLELARARSTDPVND